MLLPCLFTLILVAKFYKEKIGFSSNIENDIESLEFIRNLLILLINIYLSSLCNLRNVISM